MDLEPQTKPPRRLNYTERARLGLIARKPGHALRKVAKKNATRMQKYTAWIKRAMHDKHRCQACGTPNQALEPHHPYGRSGENLFKVVEVCTHCHAGFHRYPNLSYAEGWLQPEYKGVVRQPDHPQPFTLLPYP